MIDALEFSFGDEGEVGFFLESAYPKRPGRYRYEPYRSLGHYEMNEALRLHGVARCHYGESQEWVDFSVVGLPEHGILELTDFEFHTP